MNYRKIGLAGFLILLVALFLLNRKDVALVKQDSFSLLPISATGTEYKSVIHLNNPNLLSATIKTIDEKYFVNGVELAVLSIELNQGIPGLKETSFPIGVRFAKEDYYKAAHIDSSVPEAINVVIDGKITYSTLAGEGEIPVHLVETLTVRNL